MVQTFLRSKYKVLPEELLETINTMQENMTIMLYGRTNSGKSFTARELLTFINQNLQILRLLNFITIKNMYYLIKWMFYLATF